MRKLFSCLAVAAFGLIALGAITPSRAVDITCPANATPERLLLSQGSCDSACVAEKGDKKAGCKKACQSIHDTCEKRMQEALKKEDEDRKRNAACRGPIIACLIACKKETHDLDKCGKCAHGEPLTKFEHCLKG
jgi:hypothetical protein